MKLVAETIAALGAPVFMRTMGEESSPSAVIARWRHSGAEIDIGASHTVRVAMSLQTGQHPWRSPATRARARQPCWQCAQGV
jgi:AraC family transcriptional regulator